MDEKTNVVYGSGTYVDILDEVLNNALNNRASDVHFEPERDSLNIRFRIDGILYHVKSLNKNLQDEVSSRIKVISKIDITERRVPQDGHFEFDFQGKIHNVRVSTLPCIYGENIVLRIFDREDALIKLDSLGIADDQMDIVNNLITSPSGMVIITGPTGSGKTSFLYSALHVLNHPNKNILTVEDPVEFQMQGLRQTQINEVVGLTFAKAMRSIVRQDPDVIMLGEIRDADTVQMAVQAALTGVMILTTFHTFDVPALITRLMEMGISSSVAAQIVKGVISVRLVRKTCFSCREAHPINDLEKKFLGNINLPSVLYKGKGCEMCKNRGYIGRVGIFEVEYLDDDIKASVIERKPASYMYELLRKKRVKSLRQSAVEKVVSGVTTAEEAVRVIGFPIINS